MDQRRRLPQGHAQRSAHPLLNSSMMPSTPILFIQPSPDFGWLEFLTNSTSQVLVCLSKLTTSRLRMDGLSDQSRDDAEEWLQSRNEAKDSADMARPADNPAEVAFEHGSGRDDDAGLESVSTPMSSLSDLEEGSLRIDEQEIDQPCREEDHEPRAYEDRSTTVLVQNNRDKLVGPLEAGVIAGLVTHGQENKVEGAIDEHGDIPGAGLPEVSGLPETGIPRERSQPVPYVDTSEPKRWHAYVPIEVDAVLARIVAEHHPRYPRFIDDYRWIVHLIWTQHFIDRRFEDDARYVHLNMEALRCIVSQRKALPFIQRLNDEGIIDICHSYKAGNYSKSYRLTERYRDGKGQHVEITGRFVLKNLDHLREKKRKAAWRKGKGYGHVEKWTNALRIDAIRATAYVEAHYADSPNQEAHRLFSIRDIDLKQFRFIVDDAGRAHHSFSNLARDLRQFVTVEGEPLHQVDIRTSQPWFMHFKLASSVSDPAERKAMEDLLKSGDFYEAFGTAPMTRDEIKVAFYAMLFGPRGPSSRVSKLFSARFPGYAKAIEEVKTPEYQKMSALLQAAEADVVFDAVKRFVAKAGASVPVLTVHDSIATDLKYVHMARDALVDAFDSRYGTVPMLKDKSPFDPEEQQQESDRKPKNNNTKNMQKRKLTCISIEHAGLISTAHGQLIRYMVKFLEGLEGEYWAKTEASMKNFPLNEARWYKYSPLTKKGAPDTWKFGPCKTEEIPEVADALPTTTKSSVAETVPLTKHGASAGMLASADIAAFKAATQLAVAGKIEMKQIEPTAREFMTLIKGLSKPYDDEAPF